MAEHSTMAEKVVQNQVLIMVSRISMALALPVLGLISVLGLSWLENKFTAAEARAVAAQTAQIFAQTQLTERMNTLEARSRELERLNDEVVTLKAVQQRDTIAFERFQTNTLNRLDRLHDSINTMSNTVAGLAVAVKEIGDRMNRQEANKPRVQ